MTDALPSRPAALRPLPEREGASVLPKRLETLKLALEVGPRLLATIVALFLLVDNYAAVKQVINTLAQPENSEKVLNYLIGDKAEGAEEMAEHRPEGQPARPSDQSASAMGAYGDLMRAAVNMGSGGSDIVELARAYKDFADRAAGADPGQAAKLLEELKALHQRRHRLAQDYAGG